MVLPLSFAWNPQTEIPFCKIILYLSVPSVMELSTSKFKQEALINIKYNEL